MTEISRDELCTQYLDQLEFEPYPVQEDALLAWFSTEEGVLICAPTGTGKTLIAEAALYEALHTGKVAYYTTPLIALTEQKFQEVQDAAVKWGFAATDVGLVTGNRKVNPDAKVLVVVAEILLNRLLNPTAFGFENVAAVVMDEFHSFNDRERGIVWELSLSMLPKNVRLMLLSATVGNTNEFLNWLSRSHGRRLDLVQGTERKVPLRYHWIEDQLLNEQLEFMARGDDEDRRVPTLVFCFNREECWRVAEQLKGKSLLADGQQKLLAAEIKNHDWSQGVGPKLKTIILRGVGVHHAGVLPKYKRIVESFFQKKLLSICVCTETLAAGMNLPARSVLLTELLKGPPGKKRLIESSSAHQMFGRAGRPQFDTEGHVYALAHEDDVKIARYQERIDQIPEDTKDPQLIKKRKQLKKKAPTRRKNVQYWNETHFQKLIESPPSNLQSQGRIPWRLLAFLLSVSPDVQLVRKAVAKRLMDDKQRAKGQEALQRMLLTLESAGFIELEPTPPDIIRKQLQPSWNVESETTPERSGSLLERLQAMSSAGAFAATPQTPSEESAGQNSDAGESAGTDAHAEDDEFGAGVAEDETANGTESGTASSDSAEPATAAPQESEQTESSQDESGADQKQTNDKEDKEKKSPRLTSSLQALLEAQGVKLSSRSSDGSVKLVVEKSDTPEPVIPEYSPERAFPTEKLGNLLTFKSVNPIYGSFLVDVLPFTDGAERIQVLESVLEFPGSLLRNLRVPKPEFLPPSQFTHEFLHRELLTRGLASSTELGDLPDDWGDLPPEERVWPLTFAEKLLRLFRAEHPGVNDVRVTSVWAAGELLHFNGDFNKMITTKQLTRQEGVVFRHILRFVLLCGEFTTHVPKGTEWHDELLDISAQLTEACRAVDAHTTDMMVEAAADDPLTAELSAGTGNETEGTSADDLSRQEDS